MTIAAPLPPPDVVRAIRALARGLASEGQQRMALQWVLSELCGVAKPSHVADNDRQTAFNEGKRSVGIVLLDLAGVRPVLIESDDDGRRDAPDHDDER